MNIIKMLLLILCCSVCAETTEELKIRFMKEIEECDSFISWQFEKVCQAKISNKLYLLVLIEQMKSNGSK